MANPTQESAAQSAVLQRIRHAILDGEWPPEHRLAPAALATRFDTSTTVVREALTRLTGEHLVESRTNRGFFIPRLDLREFSDLTQLRIATETLALRLAIERGDLLWEESLLAAHHRMLRTPRESKPGKLEFNEEWRVAHWSFHQTLLAGCGCDAMLRVAAMLAQSTDLYRRWAASAVIDGKRDIEEEHRELLEATLARDTERAVALLRHHLEETARIVTTGGLVLDRRSQFAEDK
ncbi:GntR family transcriptional regulator [Paraburkholderia sp. J12]|uniref:GntR family transcriptional regulator n=1 Tax=Paraburkholderia sp. J12 TaxID=2805432 RepID=UPI002ABE3B1E|nr:GntR family transcriptional regulator [Paraburkholderia sp. J12]